MVRKGWQPSDPKHADQICRCRCPLTAPVCLAAASHSAQPQVGKARGGLVALEGDDGARQQRSLRRRQRSFLFASASLAKRKPPLAPDKVSLEAKSAVRKLWTCQNRRQAQLVLALAQAAARRLPASASCLAAGEAPPACR